MATCFQKKSRTITKRGRQSYAPNPEKGKNHITKIGEFVLGTPISESEALNMLSKGIKLPTMKGVQVTTKSGCRIIRRDIEKDGIFYQWILI